MYDLYDFFTDDKDYFTYLKLKTESISINLGSKYKQLSVCYQTGEGAWLIYVFLKVDVVSKILRFDWF